jgi:hypothetical protein
MNELDRIYLEIDELMFAGRLEDLERILSSVKIQETSTDLLLGYLTATLPVKSALRNRKGFYEDVERELIRRNQYLPGLLLGLES